jgi:hypothetical protein
MKIILLATLAAAEIFGAATPAVAHSYAPLRNMEAGTFTGARVRISFGSPARERVRAGFTLAPTVRADYQDGRVRTRIGEGVEFGFNGRGPAQFSLAGTPVNRLVQGRTGPDGQRRGISTIGWVGIGLGVVVIGVVALAEACRAGDICGTGTD